MNNYRLTIKELPQVFTAWEKGNQEKKEEHIASTLLLTCMDFRFFDEINAVIKAHNLCEDYDHIILAGAELGPLIEERPHWHCTFLQHLRLSRELHQIRHVLVLGHEDCGAYKAFVGPRPTDPAEEERMHMQYAEKLKKLIAAEGFKPPLTFEAHMLCQTSHSL